LGGERRADNAVFWKRTCTAIMFRRVRKRKSCSSSKEGINHKGERLGEKTRGQFRAATKAGLTRREGGDCKLLVRDPKKGNEVRGGGVGGGCALLRKRPLSQKKGMKPALSAEREKEKRETIEGGPEKASLENFLAATHPFFPN